MIFRKRKKLDFRKSNKVWHKLNKDCSSCPKNLNIATSHITLSSRKSLVQFFKIVKPEAVTRPSFCFFNYDEFHFLVEFIKDNRKWKIACYNNSDIFLSIDCKEKSSNHSVTYLYSNWSENKIEYLANIVINWEEPDGYKYDE